MCCWLPGLTVRPFCCTKLRCLAVAPCADALRPAAGPDWRAVAVLERDVLAEVRRMVAAGDGEMLPLLQRRCSEGHSVAGSMWRQCAA